MSSDIKLPWLMRTPPNIIYYLLRCFFISMILFFLTTNTHEYLKILVIVGILGISVFFPLIGKVDYFEKGVVFSNFFIKGKLVEWKNIKRIVLQKKATYSPMRILTENSTIPFAMVPFYKAEDLLRFIDIIREKSPWADVEQEVISHLEEMKIKQEKIKWLKTK